MNISFLYISLSLEGIYQDQKRIIFLFYLSILVIFRNK